MHQFGRGVLGLKCLSAADRAAIRAEDCVVPHYCRLIYYPRTCCNIGSHMGHMRLRDEDGN